MAQGDAPGAPRGGGLRRTDEDLQAALRLAGASGATPALDRLADLAARLLGAPSAQVSILTDVQTLAGGAGLAPGSVGSTGPLEASLCTVTAATRGPLIVPDARADERVAELPPVQGGAVGSYLGVPLAGAEGAAVGALCVFDPAPREWSDADVDLLQGLAASALAELERTALGHDLEASEARWQLAIEAGGIGTFEWNIASGRLVWDDRLLAIFGYDRDHFDGTMEAFESRVHPEDRERVSRTLAEVVETCGRLDVEYRIVLPDGRTRWIEGRGRALCDKAGRAVRLLGAAYDTTAVREGEARVARVLETMPAAFYSFDREWRFTYVNGTGEVLAGRPRDEMLGRVLWEAFPGTAGSAIEQEYRRAVDTGQDVVFEAYYPEPLEGWYELRAWPGAEGLTVYAHDVTERREAQLRAERSAARAALLATVGNEIGGTLDAEEAVARLARLVVPQLADWCIVTLVESPARAATPQQQLRDIGSWHFDPELRDTVERYASARLDCLQDFTLLTEPISTGEPSILEEGASERLASALLPGAARDALLELAPRSAVVLPLRAHGRVLGLITLLRDRPFAPEELDTAADVSARAGLALDNARLYAEQRRLAEALQRSLLTAPPQPQDLQLAVRYEPAAAVAQVGGDWYDAFAQPSGGTTLVIGDVVGHDTQAAAAMGQVRGLLRGIAVATDDSPAGILRRLDGAMEQLQVQTTATAVVARLEEPTAEERHRGVVRLRWSNAGHPPPAVISADGMVRLLGEDSGLAPDLLLGIAPQGERAEHEIVLGDGDTVLLYTDGLVEQRGLSLDEGLHRLVTTLAELAGHDVGTLCDELLVRMLPGAAEDDVALTAVRVQTRRDIDSV